MTLPTGLGGMIRQTGDSGTRTARRQALAASQRKYAPLLLCRTSTIRQRGRKADREFHAAVRSRRLARS